MKEKNARIGEMTATSQVSRPLKRTNKMAIKEND